MAIILKALSSMENWTGSWKCDECNLAGLYPGASTEEDAIEIANTYSYLHELEHHGTQA